MTSLTLVMMITHSLSKGQVDINPLEYQTLFQPIRLPKGVPCLAWQELLPTLLVLALCDHVAPRLSEWCLWSTSSRQQREALQIVSLVLGAAQHAQHMEEQGVPPEEGAQDRDSRREGHHP